MMFEKERQKARKKVQARARRKARKEVAREFAKAQQQSILEKATGTDRVTNRAMIEALCKQATDTTLREIESICVEGWKEVAELEINRRDKAVQEGL